MERAIVARAVARFSSLALAQVQPLTPACLTRSSAARAGLIRLLCTEANERGKYARLALRVELLLEPGAGRHRRGRQIEEAGHGIVDLVRGAAGMHAAIGYTALRSSRRSDGESGCTNARIGRPICRYSNSFPGTCVDDCG